MVELAEHNTKNWKLCFLICHAAVSPGPRTQYKELKEYTPALSIGIHHATNTIQRIERHIYGMGSAWLKPNSNTIQRIESKSSLLINLKKLFQANTIQRIESVVNPPCPNKPALRTNTIQRIESDARVHACSKQMSDEHNTKNWKCGIPRKPSTSPGLQ